MNVASQDYFEQFGSRALGRQGAPHFLVMNAVPEGGGLCVCMCMTHVCVRRAFCQQRGTLITENKSLHIFARHKYLNYFSQKIKEQE